jgi:hypothetical protein
MFAAEIRRKRVQAMRQHNHFNKDCHLTDRETYKANRSAALAEWRTLMA